MAGQPLSPATDRRLGGPLPHQLANQTRGHLPAIKSLACPGCPGHASCGISSRFQLLSPSSRQVPHALLTRPPLSSTSIVRKLFPWRSVRLACVKHAASVHPEPESNPTQKNLFMKRHRHDDSRNKKIDDRLIRKGASHKNLAAV